MRWINPLLAAVVVLATPSFVADAGTEAPAITSLLGRELAPQALAPEEQARMEVQLAEAQSAWEQDRNDADALIWFGRRTAYLGRYREAIAIFTDGIARHPGDARMRRHRGHRYLTVREIDRAIADFEAAARLMAGQPDAIEPDGLPNARDVPTGTLHSNVWYHLALAHYLKGDFQKAADAYVECMKVSNNDDAVTATSDWQWMTLMRLGRKADAAKVLERITPKMEILENGSYHRRLLMYKGLEKPEALLDPAKADALTIATQGYGVGNWYLVNGDRARARETFEKVVAGTYWSAFGFIAAEADLQRLGAAPGAP
jgi:tetratricopeptide (TPR) repeat protein